MIALRSMLVVCLLGWVPSTWAEQLLQVEDAWVRAAPPGQRVLAGYMRLSNASPESVRLVAVCSPNFESVEMHRSVVEQGLARMVAVDSVTIEPGAVVVFEPGGLHLMLIDPLQILSVGDQVAVTLELESGETQTLLLALRRDAGAAPDDHSHHQH